MSSIRLLKERNGAKRGTVISVPFGLGQELIAAGIGQYPDAVVNPVVQEIQVAPALAVSAAAKVPAAVVEEPKTEAPKEKPQKSLEGGRAAKP